MRLEREDKEDFLTEDELYQLSDAAKSRGSRSRASSFTLRPQTKPRRKASETANVRKEEDQPRRSGGAVSVPVLMVGNEADPDALSMHDVLAMAEDTLSQDKGSSGSGSLPVASK